MVESNEGLEEITSTPRLRGLPDQSTQTLDRMFGSNYSEETFEEIPLLEICETGKILRYRTPLLKALNHHERYEHTASILKIFKDRKDVADLVVSGIFEERYQLGSKALLLEFGPTPYLSHRLALALGHPHARDIAYTILDTYVPCDPALHALILALGDHKRADLASELVKKYDPRKLDRILVKYLQNENSSTCMKRSLANILITRSSAEGIHALVGALQSNNTEPYVTTLLLSYGPMHCTVKSLCAALHDTSIAHQVKKILKAYGPSKTTVTPLVATLSAEEARPHAYEILRAYGPTKITISTLINATVFSDLHDPAIEILAEYAGRSESAYELVMSQARRRENEVHDRFGQKVNLYSISRR